MDLDMECMKPFDDVIAAHTCLLSQEPPEHAHFLSPTGVPLVSNALMACTRGHAFFKHVINDLYSHSGWYVWDDILHATGPYMLTQEYRHFTSNGLLFSSEASYNSLYLAPADEFQPTTDPSMRDHMRQACINSEGHSFLNDRKFMERQQQLCANILRNGFRDDATVECFTNHHWTHSWAGVRNDPYNIIGTDVYINVKSLVDKRA